MEEFVKLQDITKIYKMGEVEIRAADRISFAINKGEFVVMKTGTHPMRTRLRLFLEWGITFGEPYQVPERAARKVAYAGKRQLTQAIIRKKRGTTPPADQDRGQSDYNTIQEV